MSRMDAIPILTSKHPSEIYLLHFQPDKKSHDPNNISPKTIKSKKKTKEFGPGAAGLHLFAESAESTESVISAEFATISLTLPYSGCDPNRRRSIGSNAKGLLFRGPRLEENRSYDQAICPRMVLTAEKWNIILRGDNTPGLLVDCVHNPFISLLGAGVWSSLAVVFL